MIIGSVLANFRKLELSTADGKRFTQKLNPVTGLAFRLIGLPHLGFRGRARSILKSALKLSGPQTRILDAGCGYGIYSLTLASKGRGIIDAIDLTPERIAALERMKLEQPELMKNISLQVGSVTALPFADNTFDLAICSEVIEHIPDDKKAASELLRVTKPGGRLIITVPHDSPYNKLTYREFEHERPGYSKEDLLDLFGRDRVRVVAESYHEYNFGQKLFVTFNSINSKPLMGLLFYPFYLLYRLDAALGIGEASGIVLVMEKV